MRLPGLLRTADVDGDMVEHQQPMPALPTTRARPVAQTWWGAVRILGYSQRLGHDLRTRASPRSAVRRTRTSSVASDDGRSSAWSRLSPVKTGVGEGAETTSCAFFAGRSTGARSSQSNTRQLHQIAVLNAARSFARSSADAPPDIGHFILNDPTQRPESVILFLQCSRGALHRAKAFFLDVVLPVVAVHIPEFDETLGTSRSYPFKIGRCRPTSLELVCDQFALIRFLRPRPAMARFCGEIKLVRREGGKRWTAEYNCTAVVSGSRRGPQGPGLESYPDANDRLIRAIVDLVLANAESEIDE